MLSQNYHEHEDLQKAIKVPIDIYFLSCLGLFTFLMAIVNVCVEKFQGLWQFFCLVERDG